MTEWRPVVGWEGLYEVSDDGQVRSLARTIPRTSGRPLNLPERILKAQPGGGGYLVVALCRDSRKVHRRVHRLMLEAFVGPAPVGLEGCHGNDVKTDNRLANLRWDTAKANALDKVANGSHYNARKTHCSRGHAYDEANTRRIATGRHCRTCVIDAKRRWRQRQQENAR